MDEECAPTEVLFNWYRSKQQVSNLVLYTYRFASIESKFEIQKEVKLRDLSGFINQLSHVGRTFNDFPITISLTDFIESEFYQVNEDPTYIGIKSRVTAKSFLIQLGDIIDGYLQNKSFIELGLYNQYVQTIRLTGENAKFELQLNLVPCLGRNLVEYELNSSSIYKPNI